MSVSDQNINSGPPVGTENHTGLPVGTENHADSPVGTENYLGPLVGTENHSGPQTAMSSIPSVPSLENMDPNSYVSTVFDLSLSNCLKTS